MPMWPSVKVFSVTIDGSSLATNTTVSQNVTVTGLKVSDICMLVPAGVLTSSGTNTEAEGLTFYTSQVDTADTLPVHWVNATTSSQHPGSQTFFCVVLNRWSGTEFHGDTS